MNGLSFAVSVILAAIFIGSIFDGRKKGFIKIALSLVATIICGLVAANYADPVATYVAQNFVHEPFVESVSLTLTNAISDGTQNISEALPDYIISAENS